MTTSPVTSSIAVQAFKEPMIYAAMSNIMAEVGAVAKNRNNTQQHYTFRGVDDVYQALQLIMAKHGVISLPTVIAERTEERTTKTGSALIYRVLTIRYDFYARDGSTVPATVIGEGMDSGDKASNKAMSVADKYALLQAFKVPTAEAKDPENDSPQPAPKRSNIEQRAQNVSKPPEDQPAPIEKVWAMVAEFEKIGVTSDQIADRLGITTSETPTIGQMSQLRQWYDELRKQGASK